jgi:hypothetical protein
VLCVILVSNDPEAPPHDNASKLELKILHWLQLDSNPEYFYLKSDALTSTTLSISLLT